MKFLRKQLEYIAFKACISIIPRLSRQALLRFSRAMAAIGYLVSANLRTIGKANLDLVYGDSKSDEEKLRILKTSFHSFTLAMLDSLWFSRDTEHRIQKWVRYGEDIKPFFTEKRCVCITGHFGNWEVLGILSAFLGFPLVSVYKPLKNPRVDEAFRAMRTHNGQEIVETGGAFRKLIRKLKQEKKIGLVIDQNTGADQGGLFFDFLGVPALVSTAPAALAIMTKSNLFTGFCRPLPDGSYEAFSPSGEIDVTPYLDRGEDGTMELTRKIADIIQETILKEPHIWLWMYKRWKHLPPGADPKDYPYYATTLPDHE